MTEDLLIKRNNSNIDDVKEDFLIQRNNSNIDYVKEGLLIQRNNSNIDYMKEDLLIQQNALPARIQNAPPLSLFKGNLKHHLKLLQTAHYYLSYSTLELSFILLIRLFFKRNVT